MMNRNDLAWYVCGPMTGVPRFNYPLFDIVTAHLRLTDVGVISPTELDSMEMQTAARESLTGDFNDIKPAGESWGDILARDVKLIEKEIGNFALLPGWQRSRGARLEVFVALLVGVTSFHAVIFDPTGMINLVELSVEQVRDTIRGNMP